MDTRKKVKTDSEDGVGRYDFHAVEAKWRRYWHERDLYRTGNDPGKPDYYVLDFFPYPSGEGLSVGHCRNYVPTCVTSRFMRMQGYNVLHPMGWDAFGLPAENYALKHQIHPRESTRQFAATYRRQMKLIACSYDWNREINSTDPDYYRWTQWIFLLLFKRGLAYQAQGQQWWCPTCQTILANEQVEAGRCWRCDSKVSQKTLTQWYFKITDYADRLLTDLDTVDWPDSIKQMQRNWIGRAEGLEISFGRPAVVGEPHEVRVFTTRPDTLYGVTYLALAPEHPLVPAVTTAVQQSAVADYLNRVQTMTAVERQSSDRSRAGVFTGAFAAHPMTGEDVPIWVADYVLMDVGTGAVMGVPAHDERDYAFAQAQSLPVRAVIRPSGKGHEDGCYTGHGTLTDSDPYSGLDSLAGGRQIMAALVSRGLGSKCVTYRMRDWLISRQRYWGAPIPIVHCSQCGPVAVPEDQLPVRLPEMAAFAPSGDGRSPLAHDKAWIQATCPRCNGPAQRETDTMDGFACSSWYFLRFANPHYTAGPFDPEAVARWLPVDTYVGGAEHAVMHLLYARFWTKVLADAGLISFQEPFRQLRNQGMLLSARDGRKMSKSRGNVVTPDEIVAAYGADVLRLYVLFLGPFDADVTWDDVAIVGAARFLKRYWHLAHTIAFIPEPVAMDETAWRQFVRARHQAVRRITADLSQFRFNTAVAALMAYLNELIAARDIAIDPSTWREALETFTRLLAPIAPFITEEVWQSVLGHNSSVHEEAWPEFDEAQAADDTLTVVVQVNGRVRDRLQMPDSASAEEWRLAALSSAAVRRHIDGQEIRKIVVVPDGLINIVV